MPSVTADRREVTDDLILIDQAKGPATFRMALRNRFAEHDLDARIAVVREWFGQAGRDDFTWIVGSRSSPADLAERLIARGASPTAEDPEMAAMVLSDEPAASFHSIEIRVSETFEDSLVGRNLMAELFGVPADKVPTDEHMHQIWEAARKTDSRTFIAYVNDVPVGRASCAGTTAGPLELMNAGVLPAYRGRGIYTALLRARWDEAVRRSSPILVTQAGALSRPILERFGFKTVGTIRRLEDRTDHGS
jgi:GNAT superfamily N-acetyltransferase